MANRLTTDIPPGAVGVPDADGSPEGDSMPVQPPQVIPRPEAFRTGGPSPWAALTSSRRTGIRLSTVRTALTSPVDEAAVGGDESLSAVLVALFEEDGEARVVLTRRSPLLRVHRHEVSFPGGRVDAGERLVDAARREAFEEIALDPAAVEVIGRLNTLTTVSSAAVITPFVGLLTGRPELRANPTEVERVFDVALADLMVEGVHTSEHWGPLGAEIELHFFALPGDIVWGATARILTDLLGRVLDAA